MELIRVVSLNINGYDCSITKENIKETVFVFDGISELLLEINEVKTKSNSLLALKELIVRSKNYLIKNKDYNTFNRLHFIVNYVKPLYELIYNIRGELKLGTTPVNYAVNFYEKNLFGKTFFNKYYFSVNISDSLLTNEQAELGKNLFFDPILSGNNKRACASCHKPEFAFSDPVAKNLDYNKSGFLKRNTPSLLNVMYQKNFFHDGRSLQLEDQASEVLHAKNEMNSVPVDIINKLRRSNSYRLLFRKAFRGRSDTAITFYAVLKSITEFEKTLVSMNSKFDKYIKGNKNALNKNEINGYNVFAGKALCGSCHFLPLFNGLVPPLYNDNEFEVIGAPLKPNSKEIDLDSGMALMVRRMIMR
jgi:cytochrome c peroxidase